LVSGKADMVGFVLSGIKKEAPHPVGWRAVGLAVKIYLDPRPNSLAFGSSDFQIGAINADAKA
jgi:hypothetical protein